MVAGFKSKKDRRAFFRAQAAQHGGTLSLSEQLSAKAKESFCVEENDGVYVDFPPSVSSWEELPSIVDPGLYLPEERKLRKRAQLDYMCRAFAKLLYHLQKKNPSQSDDYVDGRSKKRLTAIDFCSGGRHLGLILAACFPEINVVCLERNPRNCERIEQRKAEGGLDNVQVMCADVADALTVQDFDIGVAIHACGWMTDFVQAICLQRKASYVLCSCCVGKIAHPGPPESIKEYVMHPRSKRFQEKFTREEFLDMCKKADVDFYMDATLSGSNFDDDSFDLDAAAVSTNVAQVQTENANENQNSSSIFQPDSQEKVKSSVDNGEDVCPPASKSESKEVKDKIARRFCKTAVEVDRNAWSREVGYETFLLMMPSWATPKNDIIIGYHKD